MNRDELDAWFAQADDILTDWHSGADSMTAHASETANDESLPRADSYYEQQFAHSEGHVLPLGVSWYLSGAEIRFISVPLVTPDAPVVVEVVTGRYSATATPGRQIHSDSTGHDGGGRD